MKRVLTRILFILLLTGVTVIAFAGFLLGSEHGTRFLWSQVAGRLPEGLTIESVQGRLLGPFSIRGVSYRTDELRIEIAEADLEWAPGQLFRGRLLLESVRLRALNYLDLTPKTASKTEPLVLPESLNLPIELRIEQLIARELGYVSGPDEEPFVIDQARLSVAAIGDKLSLSQVSATGPLFELNGTAEFEMGGSYVLEGRYDWLVKPPGYPPVEGTTDVNGNLSRLLIKVAAEAPYKLEANLAVTDILNEPRFEARFTSGTIDLRRLDPDLPEIRDGTVIGDIRWADQRFNLKLDWQDWAWQTADAKLKSPEGRLVARGALDDYQVTLSTKLEAGDYLQAMVDLQGAGNLESLRLSRLKINALDGAIEGAANLAWQPVFRVEARLKGEGLDPGLLFPDWPGRLGIELEAGGEVREGHTLARVRDLRVTGRLRGYPLELTAEADYSAAGLLVKTAALASGSTEMALSGLVENDALDIQWRIDSPDLAALLPGATGHLTGSGNARGSYQRPVVETKLYGTDLNYKSYRAQSLKLDAAVDAGRATGSNLVLIVEGGGLEGIDVDRFRLSGKGGMAAHELELDAVSSRGLAQLNLRGELSDGVWDFLITEGQVGYSKLPHWSLQLPAKGKISAGGKRVKLGRSCWNSGEAILCLGGERWPERLAGEFELENLPLAHFAGLLPEDLRLEGALNGKGSFSMKGSEETPEIGIEMRSTAGQLLSLVQDDQYQPVLNFRQGGARFDLKGGSMELEAAVPLETDGGMELTARIPAGSASLLQRPLTGRLTMTMSDVGILADLIPDIERPTGRVSGEINVRGTLAAPRVRGTLKLVDGSAELVTPGLSLKNIRLSLRGDDQERIGLQAQARSGEGTLEVSGDAGLQDRMLDAALKVAGENFQILDLPEARVVVSPDLKLFVAGTRLELEGRVNVPFASIRPKTLPGTAVTVSDDQIIVRPETATRPEKPREINARVRLVLGDDVTFEGFGLSGRIRGNLLLIEQPGQLTTGSGELSIAEGTYKAYGQDLKIERGRLLFAGGPASDPGLDVRAVRQPAENVTVGVQVRGTLSKPAFELFSQPAMPQAEQLSYLVLGRPIEGGASTEQSDMLNHAAIALGLAGGDTILGQLQETIGVDEVGIESGSGGSDQQAALVIGKYLSPKLYVGYGIGIFDPISTIRLRYSITSNWKLVTESSVEASGADLFYTIDRGR